MIGYRESSIRRAWAVPKSKRTLIQLYSELGLQFLPAESAVEAGITEVWNLLVSGRLKVMKSLTNWLRGFRKYHRDDKGSGKIVKRDDHLMTPRGT